MKVAVIGVPVEDMGPGLAVRVKELALPDLGEAEQVTSAYWPDGLKLEL